MKEGSEEGGKDGEQEGKHSEEGDRREGRRLTLTYKQEKSKE